jgi:type IV secretion system protein VirD4
VIYLKLIAALIFFSVLAAIFFRATVYSHRAAKAFRWRVLLLMRPNAAFASYVHLIYRWSRFAAIRTGGRVRPDLSWRERLCRRPTDYAWRLGRASYGKTVYAGQEHQTVVISPPRTGKTALLVSRILEHPGAAVTFSSRTDLWDLTAGHRGKLGPLDVFNPYRVGGLPSTMKINLVRGCANPATAVRRACALIGDTANKGDMQFWTEKASVALAGLMHAADVAGYDMGAVYMWANRIGEQELSNINRMPGAVDELFAGIYELYRDSKSADSIRMTLARSLGWLSIPELKDMVTGPDAGEFDAGQFALSCGTVYMILRPGAEEVAGPLFRAVTDEIHFASVMAGSQTRYRKLVPGVHFCLDEVSNIGMPKLAEKLADSAGHGALFTIVIHALAQLRELYGDDNADAIFECCSTKIVLPGVTSRDTLDTLSDLCGTIPSGDKTIIAVSADAIRQLPDRRALVIQLNRQPVTVKLREPWRRLAFRLGRHPAAPAAALPVYLVPEMEVTEIDDAAA